MSRFSPPAPSSSSARTSGIALNAPSPSSPTSPRNRSRTTTQGGSPGSGLKVQTNELAVPPAFSRSKSASILGGMGIGSSSSGIGSSASASLGEALSRVASNTSNGGSGQGKRGRSSSILSIHEIKENYDDDLDQGAMGSNLNADWVNYKGAWMIHVVLVMVGKVLVDSIPGMEQDTSWTIVLQGYLLATYLMFHFVEGVPFDSHSGVYDRLTMWEQIDGGAQYTPAKKVLTCLPIGLFLLSTHYTRYDHHPALFSLNAISLVALALIPKLPQLHRQRVTFGAGKQFPSSEISTGANTPVETAMQRATLPSLPE